MKQLQTLKVSNQSFFKEILESVLHDTFPSTLPCYLMLSISFKIKIQSEATIAKVSFGETYTSNFALAKCLVMSDQVPINY